MSSDYLCHAEQSEASPLNETLHYVQGDNNAYCDYIRLIA